MKTNRFNNFITYLAFLLMCCHGGLALSYTATGAIDAVGNNAASTIVGAVDCKDDGRGVPAYFAVSFKDKTKLVSGLYMSLHLFKDDRMVSVTEISGDTSYSTPLYLYAGSGRYYMAITKTKAGTRLFDIAWYCMTADGKETGFSFELLQDH